MTPDIIGTFIPIVAIVMGIGIGMLKLFLNYRKRKDMFALYHQERMAAIEKGIELPPFPEKFFDEFPTEKFLDKFPTPSRHSPHRTLLQGLILVFIGLTLYLALHFTITRTDGGGDAALFALIPGGIGVACLIYYFTVGRKMAAEMEEERKARLAEASRGGKP
jgi:hypothetical protein